MQADTSSLWLRQALQEPALQRLDRVAATAGKPGGRVDWTEPDLTHALAPVTAALQADLLPNARLVRAVWFTKDATANWGVAWHQDRVIAVAERHEIPGYRNWSLKGDVWHCEPPLPIFAMLRFVRLHLDDQDAANGAMEIARGSEVEGMVPETKAAEVAARYPMEPCEARRGDIQVLPMLVLHRSHPARTAVPRRALRLDYAVADLPAPLAWRGE